MSERRMTRVWFAALLAVSICSGAVAQEAPAPPAVQVTEVARVDVSPTLSFNGRVQAVDKVDIIAQVSAIIEEQTFQDGAMVEAGDLLFRLDRERFAARVQQHEADLASAEANAENARVQLARAEELVKSQNIAEATVDERRAASLTADATILQARAALREAQIDLDDTEIKSPIRGRVGAPILSVGALVGPSTGPLVTVVSQDPVYVTFPISQRQLQNLRQDGAAGSAEDDVVVNLILANGSTYGEDGKPDFMDVVVNPSTDTQIARASFPNPDGILVDGQLVRVKVSRTTPVLEIVVPQRSLLSDQKGSFVLVVDDTNTVQRRDITIGSLVGDQVTVRSGLSEGERVIVEGLQKVTPGIVVTPGVFTN